MKTVFILHVFLVLIFLALLILDIYRYLNSSTIWILGQIILDIVCVSVWFILVVFDIKEIE